MGAAGLAVAIGCLTVLRWVLAGTAALLVLLVVVQALRGDEGARPLANLGFAGLIGAGGWASGRFARWLHG